MHPFLCRSCVLCVSMIYHPLLLLPPSCCFISNYKEANAPCICTNINVIFLSFPQV